MAGNTKHRANADIGASEMQIHKTRMPVDGIHTRQVHIFRGGKRKNASGTCVYDPVVHYIRMQINEEVRFG